MTLPEDGTSAQQADEELELEDLAAQMGELEGLEDQVTNEPAVKSSTNSDLDDGSKSKELVHAALEDEITALPEGSDDLAAKPASEPACCAGQSPEKAQKHQEIVSAPKRRGLAVAKKQIPTPTPAPAPLTTPAVIIKKKVITAAPKQTPAADIAQEADNKERSSGSTGQKRPLTSGKAAATAESDATNKRPRPSSTPLDTATHLNADDNKENDEEAGDVEKAAGDALVKMSQEKASGAQRPNAQVTTKPKPSLTTKSKPSRPSGMALTTAETNTHNIDKPAAPKVAKVVAKVAVKANPAAGTATKVAAKPKVITEGAVKKGPAAKAAKSKTEDGDGTKKAVKKVAGEKRPRAKSSFMFFADDKRKELKESDPTLTVPEMGKRLGEMWKAASDEEKQPYEAKAAADKAAVKSRQADWDTAHPKVAADEDDDKPAKKKQKTDKKAAASVPKAAAAPVKLMTGFEMFQEESLELLKEEAGSSSVTPAMMMEVLQAWELLEDHEKQDWGYKAQARSQEAAQTAAAAADDDEPTVTAAVKAAPKKKAAAAAKKTKPTDAEPDSQDHQAAAGLDGNLELEGSPTAAATAKKTTKAKKAGGDGGGGRKKKGGKRSKAGTAADSQEDCDAVQQQDEEEDEEDEITAMPELIFADDERGRYWVLLEGNLNMFDFKFVSIKKVRQVRSRAAAAEAGGQAAAAEEDDGFNGYGQRLLQLADEYERWRRNYDKDAREVMDSQGGLNFDLMPQGSLMDTCALLNALRDGDIGGKLARKPSKKNGAVKGVDDMMINTPALMLSMFTQRMVCYWRDQAMRWKSIATRGVAAAGETASSP